VGDALATPRPEPLQFVLGTESGMITSIVRRVQGMLQQGMLQKGMLQKAGRDDVAVEVVFPVSSSAITTAQQTTSGGAELPLGLSMVPGVASGEGCSLEGGCASCPYMKMNTLSALLSVCDKIGSAAGEALLAPYQPRSYGAEQVGGRSLASAGCVPILHMRHFQKSKALSAELLADITSRGPR
ncbi:hypothetical protein TSOC_011378, partial [Tetrabaena socialis]